MCRIRAEGILRLIKTRNLSFNRDRLQWFCSADFQTVLHWIIASRGEGEGEKLFQDSDGRPVQIVNHRELLSWTDSSTIVPLHFSFIVSRKSTSTFLLVRRQDRDSLDERLWPSAFSSLTPFTLRKRDETFPRKIIQHEWNARYETERTCGQYDIGVRKER